MSCRCRLNYLELWFSNFSVYQNYLEILLKHRFLGPNLKSVWFSCLGQGLRICISNKFPEDGWCSWFRDHTLKITGLERKNRNLSRWETLIWLCQSLKNWTQKLHTECPYTPPATQPCRPHLQEPPTNHCYSPSVKDAIPDRILMDTSLFIDLFLLVSPWIQVSKMKPPFNI